MKSTLFFVSISLLLTLEGVESAYYVYTYDNDGNGDEKCCFVRKDDNFCLAKPLTRSLLQANKECQRLDPTGNNKQYLNQVVRRLDIEKSQKVDDEILIELKAPLEENVLQNDLVCLSPKNTNNINLDKCVVELAPNENKKKKKKNNKKLNTTADQVVTEETPEDDTGARLIELSEPLQVREGQGLVYHEFYDLNLTDFRPSSRLYRECWSWYRTRTRALCNHPGRFGKACISLTNAREKCIAQLFHKTINDNEREAYSTNILTVGSRLFCEDSKNPLKLLGYYHGSEICFQSHSQIYIQHKFTDFVSLSDKKKNRPVLEFILNSTKLTNEFESDCGDKETLNEIKKSLEEQQEQQQKQEESTVDDTNPSPNE